MNRTLLQAVILIFLSAGGSAQVLHLKSPNGKIEMDLENGAKIRWSVKHNNTEVVAPSAISLTLGSGEIL